MVVDDADCEAEIGVCEEDVGGAEVVVDDAVWEGESDTHNWGSRLRLWTFQLDSLPNSCHENSDSG